MDSKLESLISRLEAVVTHFENINGGQSAEVQDEAVNPFTEFATEPLNQLTALAAELPNFVQEMTKSFVDAQKVSEKIVGLSQKCKKPTDQELAELSKPINEEVKKIDKATGFKNDPQFNPGKLMKEAASTAFWVVVPQAPSDFVDNTFQGGEYYGLMIVKENKGKNDTYVKWFQTLKKYCLDLQKFVKENFRTGLSWKPTGVSVSECQNASSAAPPPAPAVPAAPPAPPVSAAPAVEAPAKPKIDAAALMNEINQGEGITARLRKVKPEEKTKNRPPEERVSTVPSTVGVKKETSAPAPAKTAKPAAAPVFKNFGNKLQIENQVKNKEMVFESETNQQKVYMYNCRECTLRVTGKLNNIVVDKCVKCQVVVDDVISVFEIINSRDIDIQIVNVGASVDVESSESVRIYVSAEGMKHVEVFSAKSSNVSVYAPGTRVDPDTNEEIEDMFEHPLPSTLRSVFADGKMDHSFVKHG